MTEEERAAWARMCWWLHWYGPLIIPTLIMQGLTR